MDGFQYCTERIGITQCCVWLGGWCIVALNMKVGEGWRWFLIVKGEESWICCEGCCHQISSILKTLVLSFNIKEAFKPKKRLSQNMSTQEKVISGLKTKNMLYKEIIAQQIFRLKSLCIPVEQSMPVYPVLHSQIPLERHMPFPLQLLGQEPGRS